MGHELLYCDKCGAQIPGVELERGRAATRAGKHFCAECAPALPPETPGTGVLGGEKRGSGTRVRKREESPRDTDVIRNLSGMASRNTTRVQAVHAPEPSGAASGLPAGAKVGIAVGGLALVILLAVVIGGSGSGGGGGSKGDEARGKKAWEELEGMRGKATGKVWFEAAQRGKRDAAGTEYEGKVAGIAREAQALMEQEEKAEKVEREFNRVYGEARGSEDPTRFMAAFQELKARARAEAPKLVERIDAAMTELTTLGLTRELGRVDMGFAGTLVGYKKIAAELDELQKKASAAGAPGKPVLDAIAKKRKEALERFEQESQKQYDDLAKRVERMLEDAMLDEAQRAAEMFKRDYAGTPYEAKSDDLLKKVAAKRTALDASWIVPKESDWRNNLGEARVSFAGATLAFSHDAPAGSPNDNSRQLVFGGADATWKDYELECELKLERVGGAILMRVNGAEPAKLGFPVQPPGGGEGLPPGQWFKLKVKVAGLRLTFGGPTIGERTVDCKEGTGGFSFVCYAGGKFEIKNVRVRKLK
jgi:hypothetical protein